MAPRTINGSVTNGGRSRARRILPAPGIVLAASVIWAVCAGLAAPSLAAADSDAAVSVREDHGYSVAATFHVAQPASIAYAVLTDYEGIPRYMPDVRTSSVVERGDDRAVIEQEAIARFMLFSKRVHLVLEVKEEQGTIRFRDRCGKSFTRYEGAWTMGETDGQTDITYVLTAQPSFDVPEILLKRLLKRDASHMIEKLQAEMTARASARRP